MKVLIAEDEPITRQLLDKTLSKWGYEVIAANNGQEAFDVLQKGEVKLVIADWLMPLMDGIELCRKIRLSKKLGYIYIILLTGKGRKEDAVTGLEAGADDYITKPFEWEELKARIRAGERILTLIDEIKTLSGMLPICSYCKKIRDDKGYWNQIEVYITKHSDAMFSHSMCPDCEKKAYEELEELKKKKQG